MAALLPKAGSGSVKVLTEPGNFAGRKGPKDLKGVVLFQGRFPSRTGQVQLGGKDVKEHSVRRWRLNENGSQDFDWNNKT